MAGSSSPALPVPGTSGRLETSRFGKQRGTWFHSLPAVRPKAWGRLELRSPNADDAATTTTAEQHLAATWTSDSQEATSRRPCPLLETAAERRLTRAPVSLPLCWAEKGARIACRSPSGALSAEPQQRTQEPEVMNAFCEPTEHMRPKAWSTEVKTVNLETSLRLVPQAVSTPVVVAVAKVRSGASSHRSRGEDFRAAKKALIGSSRPKKGGSESPRSRDVRWIDRGAVVSPTRAVVLHNPLKVWRKTSVSDNEERRDVFTEASEGSQSSITKSSLNEEAGVREAKQRTPTWTCIDAVPLFLLLAVLCLLGLWGLHALTANKNSGVAYSLLGGKANRPGGGVGDSLTVPPEDDLKPAPRRLHGKRTGQDQQERLEQDGFVTRTLSGQDASVDGVTDGVGKLHNASAVANPSDVL